MAAELLDWLLRTTLALSVAIAVVLALRPLWRRALGTASVLWLWLLLPAALLATSLPRPDRVVEVAAVSAAQADAVPALAAPILAVDAPLESDVASAAFRSVEHSRRLPLTLTTLLLIAWILGGLMLADRLMSEQRAFRRRLGPLSERGDGSFSASTQRVGPVIIGALRPRIVVPADFEQRYDAEQRALVLAHERVHLRRGDLQVNLLLCTLRCVFWFNPLVHMAAYRLRLDQELACDDVVLRRHPEAGRAYATALLNTQLADLGLPVGCYWQSRHPLKWRITLLQQPRPGSARLAVGAGVALIATSAAAYSMWQAQPADTLHLPAALAPARAAVPGFTSERVDVAAPGAIRALDLREVGERDEPAPAVTEGGVEPVAAPAVALPAPAAAPAALAPPAAASLAVATASPPTPASSAPTAPARAAQDTPTADTGFQAPRVTRVWLADLPARRTARDRQVRLDEIQNIVVQLDVDTAGRPLNPKVVQTTLGRAFQDQALDAVRRWKFEPARRDGVAVASTILVPVSFDLGRQRMDHDTALSGFDPILPPPASPGNATAVSLR